MNEKKLALLTGGESAEREVAFWSAKNVEAELVRAGYEVTVFDVPSELPAFLESKDAFEGVVPVLHGKGGEDGTIQGFLETIKMPYLFSGVEASAIAMDKAAAKAIVSVWGLQTPNAVRLRASSRDRFVFEQPVVVKPVDGGSSAGTSVVMSAEKLAEALDAGFAVSEELLIEDFVQGKEYTVPVIEDLDGIVRALDVIGIAPVVDGGFYDFEAKYGSDTPAEHLLPAPLPTELYKNIQDAAVLAHRAVGARHVSRSDFFVSDAGEILFIEINTIPGCTDASLLPEAIRYSGRDFSALLKSWIDSVV